MRTSKALRIFTDRVNRKAKFGGRTSIRQQLPTALTRFGYTVNILVSGYPCDGDGRDVAQLYDLRIPNYTIPIQHI